MSIEGILLELFSALQQIEINSPKKPYPCHAVFNYFLSYDNKKDAAKHLLPLLIHTDVFD